MINLRYHIVSLVAVFLALALGVIVGSTVVDQGVVRLLQDRQDALEGRQATLESENASLRASLEVWERFGDPALTRMTAGRLRGTDVVLVVEPGIDGAIVDDVDVTLVAAGAAPAGRIMLSQGWLDADRTAAESLSPVLDLLDDPGEELVPAAARALGVRLRAPGPAEDDLLAAVARAGLADVQIPETRSFPPPGAVIVYVSAGVDGVMPDPERFSLPLLRALADGGVAAVVEPIASAGSLADRVRGDGDLADLVATVDHADTAPGRVALIEALRDLLAGADAAHYGIGRRAASVAPPMR